LRLPLDEPDRVNLELAWQSFYDVGRQPFNSSRPRLIFSVLKSVFRCGGIHPVCFDPGRVRSLQYHLRQPPDPTPPSRRVGPTACRNKCGYGLARSTRLTGSSHGSHVVTAGSHRSSSITSFFSCASVFITKSLFALSKKKPTRQNTRRYSNASAYSTLRPPTPAGLRCT
jgi:hypothetical protein